MYSFPHSLRAKYWNYKSHFGNTPLTEAPLGYNHSVGLRMGTPCNLAELPRRDRWPTATFPNSLHLKTKVLTVWLCRHTSCRTCILKTNSNNSSHHKFTFVEFCWFQNRCRNFTHQKKGHKPRLWSLLRCQAGKVCSHRCSTLSIQQPRPQTRQMCGTGKFDSIPKFQFKQTV